MIKLFWLLMAALFFSFEGGPLDRTSLLRSVERPPPTLYDGQCRQKENVVFSCDNDRSKYTVCSSSSGTYLRVDTGSGSIETDQPYLSVIAGPQSATQASLRFSISGQEYIVYGATYADGSSRAGVNIYRSGILSTVAECPTSRILLRNVLDSVREEVDDNYIGWH